MKIFVKFLFLISIFTSVTFAKDLDMNKVLDDAKVKNKQVMIFFHIPRCPYCDRMLKKNFKDEKILSIMDKYFIHIDIYTADKIKIMFKDFKGTPKEFAKHIGASAYPATLFMDENGKVVYRSIGYRNISEYENELEYIGTKTFEKIDSETNEKIDLDTFIMNKELAEDE